MKIKERCNSKMYKSYFYKTTETEKISKEEFEKTDVDDFFGEVMILFSASVIDIADYQSISQAEFHYSFEFKKIDENTVEVIFSDTNRPTLNLLNHTPEWTEFHDIMNEHENIPIKENFDEFFIKKLPDEILMVLKKINKEYFFDFDTNGMNIHFDKEQLKELKVNFLNDVNEFLENIKSFNYEDINIDHKYVAQEDLMDLTDKTTKIIKENLNQKLNQELPNQSVKQKFSKV